MLVRAGVRYHALGSLAVSHRQWVELLIFSLGIKANVVACLVTNHRAHDGLDLPIYYLVDGFLPSEFLRPRIVLVLVDSLEFPTEKALGVFLHWLAELDEDVKHD